MQRVNYDDLELDYHQVLYKDGVPFTGTAYELSPTGHLIGEVCFVDGIREGPATDFFPNGQRESTDCYQHGSKHGECWQWYASGQAKARAVYEHSILLEAEEWDEHGSVLRQYRLDPQSPQFRTLELLRQAYQRQTP